MDLDFFFLDISFEYFLSFILDYVKNYTEFEGDFVVLPPRVILPWFSILESRSKEG